MKYLALLILLISIFTLFAHRSDIKYKEPFSNTRILDSLINLNNKQFFKDSIIIIYTYLGCRPCQVLAQKIQKKFNKPEYWKRIVFVNDIDIAFDTLKLKQHLKSKEFSFPYLLTKDPEINGTYPLICFYDRYGNLINKLIGYSSSNFSMIKNFLEK